jgi:hypothetical protein
MKEKMGFKSKCRNPKYKKLNESQVQEMKGTTCPRKDTPKKARGESDEIEIRKNVKREKDEEKM